MHIKHYASFSITVHDIPVGNCIAMSSQSPNKEFDFLVRVTSLYS